MNENNIEGLVVIGGNGSQTGTFKLHEMGFPVVGVASTIDNDLVGTDITIGVDTALNIALEAIDRLKVTGSSHQRGFLIEVMGRKCGYLALMAAIAGGAETVVIPEVESDPEEIAQILIHAYEKGKSHAIVVVAEAQPITRRAWRNTSNNTKIASDLHYVSLCWVMYNAAAHLALLIVFSPAV